MLEQKKKSKLLILMINNSSLRVTIKFPQTFCFHECLPTRTLVTESAKNMSSACRARGKLTPLHRKLRKLSAASLQLCLAPVWRLSRILTENIPCFVPALGKLSQCKDVLPPHVFWHASYGMVSLSRRCCEKGPLAASAPPASRGW